MPEPMQSEPRAVGKYQLLERLAVGGMAEIFLACERGAHEFERLVVIKKILPHLVEDQAFIDMFLHEARISARVAHPNVVQIFELGESDGEPYMAMEYVPGSTVRQLLRASSIAQEPVPVGVALDLAIQACAGAHAVHELTDPHGNPYGLVHRDLTPHNLMVTDEGWLKLLDFGIVKATEGEHRTRTGVLKGKVAYMSPEQCQQEPLDRRSDIFSLGACTWEVLAGDKLFSATTEIGAMTSILEGRLRDLREIRPDVPIAVVEAVERALRTERDERYASADAMRRALAEAARTAGVDVDRDETGAFVAEMLGERHERRRRSIDSALDRTLVGFGPDPVTETSTHTALTQATQIGWAGAVGWMAVGVGGGAFALAVVALVAMVLFEAGVLGDGAADRYVPPTGRAVSVVHSPVLDDDVLLSDLEPLRRYLETELEQPVEFTVSASYSEASTRLLEGKTEFAVLPPYLYLKTKAMHPQGVHPVAVKVYDGSSGFDAVILVHHRSDVGGAQDLVGATICYSDLNSTTGYMLPRAWLRDQGLDPDDDLQSHVSGNHLQLLRDLIDGTCDVAGTYSGNVVAADEVGIQVAQTRTLAVIGRTPHDVVAAGPAASAAVIVKVQVALLAFDPVEHLGRERLGESEQITGFDPIDEAAFDRLRRQLDLTSKDNGGE